MAKRGVGGLPTCAMHELPLRRRCGWDNTKYQVRTLKTALETDRPRIMFRVCNDASIDWVIGCPERETLGLRSRDLEAQLYDFLAHFGTNSKDEVDHWMRNNQWTHKSVSRVLRDKLSVDAKWVHAFVRGLPGEWLRREHFVLDGKGYGSRGGRTKKR